ncbi:hypothetical protein BWI15_30995 [Kribbella sp. ALI-6-A]|nr:hypothetical protein BWI15_30995 [Kribbella sp. ALI-6-A]
MDVIGLIVRAKPGSKADATDCPTCLTDGIPGSFQRLLNRLFFRRLLSPAWCRYIAELPKQSR